MGLPWELVDCAHGGCRPLFHLRVSQMCYLASCPKVAGKAKADGIGLGMHTRPEIRSSNIFAQRFNAYCSIPRHDSLFL